MIGADSIESAPSVLTGRVIIICFHPLSDGLWRQCPNFSHQDVRGQVGETFTVNCCMSLRINAVNQVLLSFSPIRCSLFRRKP